MCKYPYFRDPRRRRKTKKGAESLFDEIMDENFPIIKKETDIQVLEGWRVPNKMSSKRPTPRHIAINVTKVKETILKAARRKTTCDIQGQHYKTIS